MALKDVIKVKDIRIESRTNFESQSEFKVCTITGQNGRTYQGILNDNLVIPEVSDVIEISYQPLNNFNSIIGIKHMTKPNNASNTAAVDQGTPATDKSSFIFKGNSFYARIKEPDLGTKEYPKKEPEYNINISVSDKTADALKALGVEVKNKADSRGNYVIARSKKQPLIQNADGETITDIPLIGNGSSIEATCRLYKNKAKLGGEHCLGLNALKITNLVVYEAKMLTDE